MENSFEKFREDVLNLLQEFKETIEDRSLSTSSDSILVIRNNVFSHLIEDLYSEIKNYNVNTTN